MKPEDLGTIPRSRRKTARANPVGKVSALAGAKEVFETIDLGIIHLDIDARILYMNSPAASLLREASRRHSGMVFWELLPETLVGIFSETFRAAREKATCYNRNPLSCTDGFQMSLPMPAYQQRLHSGSGGCHRSSPDGGRAAGD